MIGNAAYVSLPLQNPVNDAVAMAALLEKRNFDVTLLKNANQEQIEISVEVFGRKLGNGCEWFSELGIHIEVTNGKIEVVKACCYLYFWGV